MCFYSDLGYNSNIPFDFFYFELVVQPNSRDNDEISCHKANKRVDNVPSKEDKVTLAREERHKRCSDNGMHLA